jgi:hypothetical protein
MSQTNYPGNQDEQLKVGGMPLKNGYPGLENAYKQQLELSGKVADEGTTVAQKIASQTNNGTDFVK